MTDPSIYDRLQRASRPIDRLYRHPLELKAPFERLARQFAGLPGSVVLMSGGDLDCARFHLLGARPWLTVEAEGRHLTCRLNDQTIQWRQDPFEFLDWLLRTYSLQPPALDRDLPLCAGLMGYFSYDLKDYTETLPRTSVKDLALPHLWLAAHQLLIIHDQKSGQTDLLCPVWDNTAHTDLQALVELAQAKIAAAETAQPPAKPRCGELRSNFSKEQYKQAVRDIKDYIAAGDVYQVNLSQRFEAAFDGNAFDLFESYFQLNPAPFYGYVQTGTHQIVSTSPERFLQLRDRQVETRPIKGTRPRDANPQKDDCLRQELKESLKDDAELSMIVDLLRNDIGKVCEAGSVRVSQHKRVEAYENVYHLVSTVEGVLESDRNAVDLILATFPGGSITGCPKIRAMEIIDELEPQRRHVYTGSLGYISFHGTLDLSIAIRTATVFADRIFFSVGGGIVYDSDPEEEYQETLHKGRTLIRGIQDAETTGGDDNPPSVWIDGRYLPQRDACVSVMSEGVQYGYGFFETLRADLGHVFRLEAHLTRFRQAWQRLFEIPFCDITWPEVIQQVLAVNGLTQKTAAIKLLALKGGADHPAPHLMVSARPYQHRLQMCRRRALCLGVYPEPRQSPLADYKSTNYLYYDMARRWALTAGFHEALILNPDGTVSECNTANVLAIRDQCLLRPVSPHVLKGVMEAAVIDGFKQQGFEVVEKPMFPEDLKTADHVVVTNALMGCVPVDQIGKQHLRPPSSLCEKINQTLWND